ncbi:M2 family metallopeptidase [Pelagibius litoralis]|uniref:M2 family metallopeptidase n=1 Tax=Pelagibius litoralis TaxID=374515 RepID=A0A967F1S8_9PROT|nr:M2 family metallopeptidase [Pelagibius litoralis]NIA71361.1 M2 family metallopeptidase [Pelagibius litoralis]
MRNTVHLRKLNVVVAISSLALIAVCAGQSQSASNSGEGAGVVAEAPQGAEDDMMTAADAREFIERVEKFRREFGEYSERVAWSRATNITYDTDWLVTKVEAENTAMGVKFANEAKRFNDVDLPAEDRRKIELIKLGVNLPAPERPGAALELSEINTRMASTYATGKIELGGKQVGRNDLEEMMGTVRDPARLQEIWTKWRSVPVATRDDGGSMKSDYAAMVALANEGAGELGFDDVGAMWRARYDLPPAEFAVETDRLWGQVKPLYDELQCHVRAKLNEKYGDEIVPLDQPIRADLLGNMWAQSWGNIYDLVAPDDADSGFDLTELLVDKGYDARKMVETGEAFFSSLGFDPLPETFWERSLITKPADREVVCHASAWNLDGQDDIRIKMCTKVNADDFQTVHHELGHNYYQRAYKAKSPIFQTGANGGFHEAIGDMIALSITPEYLQSIDLLEEVPDASKDIGLLMNQALDKIAFMPFGLLMDKWRWQVFSGELTPETYNDGWWALRTQYQGIRPPVARSADHFDPGGKYHIPNNVSYTRYFIAHVLQFQFHKTACEMAGWEGPLHRCSIYGAQNTVGPKFNAMLELGAEKPWPEALETFTGSPEMDGGAVVEYFEPLMDWLKEQNADRRCGW